MLFVPAMSIGDASEGRGDGSHLAYMRARETLSVGDPRDGRGAVATFTNTIHGSREVHNKFLQHLPEVVYQGVCPT